MLTECRVQVHSLPLYLPYSAPQGMYEGQDSDEIWGSFLEDLLPGLPRYLHLRRTHSIQPELSRVVSGTRKDYVSTSVLRSESCKKL